VQRECPDTAGGRTFPVLSPGAEYPSYATGPYTCSSSRFRRRGRRKCGSLWQRGQDHV